MAAVQIESWADEMHPSWWSWPSRPALCQSAGREVVQGGQWLRKLPGLCVEGYFCCFHWEPDRNTRNRIRAQTQLYSCIGWAAVLAQDGKTKVYGVNRVSTGISRSPLGHGFWSWVFCQCGHPSFLVEWLCDKTFINALFLLIWRRVNFSAFYLSILELRSRIDKENKVYIQSCHVK